MKTLLAAALIALPLASLAGDGEAPAPDKAATAAPEKGTGATAKDGKKAEGAAAKDAKAAKAADAKKKGEKPCEPVKPCSID